MPRFPARLKARFYKDLAKYAKAGNGLDKAFEIIRDQRRTPAATRLYCEGVLRGLEQRQSIASSLRRMDDVSPLEIAVVDAAERGGAIESAFENLGEHFEAAHETRRRVLKGLIYPVILLHFAIGVSVLGTTIFTNFQNQWNNSRSEFSWEPAINTLKVVGVGYLFALVVVFLISRVWKAVPTQIWADKIFARIPVWGPALRAASWQRFCGAFAMFLNSGQRVSEAFRGSGNAAQSAVIGRAAEESAEAIEAGSRLTTGAIFMDDPVYPDDLARGISASDDTGGLDEEFARWAQHYRNEAKERFETVAKWTPKIFYIGVVLMVGFLLARVAQSYYGMLNGILDGI